MKKLLIKLTLLLVLSLTYFPFIANAQTKFVEIVSGNHQTDIVSQVLTNPFIIKAKDINRNALSGQTVTFTIKTQPANNTGASLSTTTATTDANGLASTTLTLGDTPGTYTITATVDQLLTVTFFATALSQPVATSIGYTQFTGINWSGTVGQVLDDPFVVKVKDQYGNGMSGQTVTFAITAQPANSAGASLSTTTATTDANGLASTTLTLGDTAGAYTVTATLDGDLYVSLTVEAVEPPVATTLEIVSGNNQTGTMGQALASSFVVRLKDQNGSAMSGQTVTFSIGTKPVSSMGASLSATTATTGAKGLASTTLTLGDTPGTYEVTASVTKSDGTKLEVSFTATATAAPPPPPPPPAKVATTLQKRSGDGQSAQVSTQLSSAFVVRVLDQDGNALGGVSVSFSVSPSSGRLSASSATTGSNGQASTRLTLGSTTGTYTVTASVTKSDNTKLTVTFTATANAAPPPPPPDKIATTLEKRSGDGQSAQVNTQLSSAFVVRVLDQDGAALSGVSVSFSVSPSGTLSASTASTGTDGQASTTLTLGSTAGTYTVTARVSGIATTVSFTATATAAPPPAPAAKVATTLEKRSGDGQSAQVSTQLSSAFVVRVLDQEGVALGGVSVSFSVSPSGILSASSATTNTQGEASTTLTLGSTAGTYTVTASTTKTDGAKLEVSFTATATAPPPPQPPPPSPPAKVATTLEKVSGDGQSAQVNTQLSSALVVRVLDQESVALGGVLVSFSVSPSGTLSASTATTNVQGEASTTLTLGSTAGTYTVTASVEGITSTVSFTATATASPVTPDPVAPGPVIASPGTPDPVAPATSDPATPDAAWGEVVFSEVMYASNGWSDIQWIELYNTLKTETIQLEGWRLTVLSPEGETSYERSVTIELKPIELEPEGVILFVTRKADKAQHSDGIEEQMIYDLSEHHNDVLALDRVPRRIIGITGFTLQLFSRAGIQVDRLGNIPLDYADPANELLLSYRFGDITESGAVGRTRDKRRVSLIRRPDNGKTWDSSANVKASDGDTIGAWKRTATLAFTEENPRTYYGSATDIGTPGYIYEQLPVPVTLSAFSARTSGNAVVLNWTTESEIDNAGFNILRSETADGAFEVVNPKLIAGAGTTAERNEYTWTDTTAKPNTFYYYRIEDISYVGVRKALATVQLRGFLTAKGKFTTTWADFKTLK